MNRRALTAIALLLIVLLGGYGVLRALGLGHDQETQAAASSAFSDAQRQKFDVLQGPTRPVPLALQADLRRARNEDVRKLRLNRARHAPAGSGVWVVNGRGVTCIVEAHGGAVACVPRGIFLREGVALGVVEPGPPHTRKGREFLVLGVVPNQVRAVDLQVGHEKRVIAVRENSYSLGSFDPVVVNGFERQPAG